MCRHIEYACVYMCVCMHAASGYVSGCVLWGTRYEVSSVVATVAESISSDVKLDEALLICHA